MVLLKVGDLLSTEHVIKSGELKQKNSLFGSWKSHSYIFDGHILYRVKHLESSKNIVEIREIFPLFISQQNVEYEQVIINIDSAEGLCGKKNSIVFYFGDNPYYRNPSSSPSSYTALSSTSFQSALPGNNSTSGSSIKKTMTPSSSFSSLLHAFGRKKVGIDSSSNNNSSNQIDELEEYYNQQQQQNNHSNNNSFENLITINTSDLMLGKNNTATTVDENNGGNKKKKIPPKYLMASSEEDKASWMEVLGKYISKEPLIRLSSPNDGIISIPSNTSLIGNGSLTTNRTSPTNYPSFPPTSPTTATIDGLNNSTSIVSTIEAMIDAVVVSDVKGEITAFNSQAEALFGYKKKDIIGKDIKILMTFDIAKHHDQYMTNFRKTGNKNLIGKPRILPVKLSNGQLIEVKLSLGEIPGTTDNDRNRFMAVMRRNTNNSSSSNNTSSSDENTEGDTSSESTSSLASNNGVYIPSRSSSVTSTMSGVSLPSVHSPTDDVLAQEGKNQVIDVQLNQDVIEIHHKIGDLQKSISTTIEHYNQNINKTFRRELNNLEKKFQQLEEKDKHLEKVNSRILSDIHNQKNVVDFLTSRANKLYNQENNNNGNTNNTQHQLMSEKSYQVILSSLKLVKVRYYGSFSSSNNGNNNINNATVSKTTASPKTPSVNLQSFISGVDKVLTPRSQEMLTSLTTLAFSETIEFNDILSNDYALKYFLKFCYREHSLENMKLYLYLTRFYFPEVKLNSHKAQIMRQYIIDNFIIIGSPYEINLSSTNRKKILDRYFRLREYEMEQEKERKQWFDEYHRSNSFNRKSSVNSNNSEHHPLLEDDSISEDSKVVDDQPEENDFLKPNNNNTNNNNLLTIPNKRKGSSNSSGGRQHEEMHPSVRSEDGSEYDELSEREWDESTEMDMLSPNQLHDLESEETFKHIEDEDQLFNGLLANLKVLMLDTFKRFIQSELFGQMKEEIKSIHEAEMKVLKSRLSSMVY